MEREMIKRSKGKSKDSTYMLFGIKIYKGNTYLIIETPTNLIAETPTKVALEFVT